MASYFGMDVSGSTDLNGLVDAYRSTRQGDLDAITTQKQGFETSLSFWNTVHNDVNSINNAIDKFDIEGAEEDFITRKTKSSDDSIVTVSSKGAASIGTTLIQVDKLAEKDLLLSGRLNLDEKFGETGTKVFSINVGEDEFDISVEFTGEETNGEALQKISDAINETEDIKINAAYVKDTPNTGVLSLMANNTGSNNTISISGSPMLSKLGLDNLVDADGNRKSYEQGQAGYMNADAQTLNAKFDVNGISIIRNENTVDDVIEGMTITLKKAQDEGAQPIYLETDIDVDEVKELLQPTLTAYNKIVEDLYVNKAERRNNSSLGNLYTNLRDVPSSKITGIANTEMEYIMALGITSSDTGQLSFSDDEKLYDALKEYPEKVAQLFVAEDGFISKLQEIIKNYHGENNLVTTMKDQLNDQIDRADDEYKRVQSNINKEASNLEKQYTDYLSTYYEAQNQLNYLQTMPTSASSNSQLLQSYYGG
jgi:flagellar hook-associated protein 2